MIPPVKRYDLYVFCSETTVIAITEKGKQYMSGYIGDDHRYGFSELYPEDIENWSKDGMNIKVKL